LGQGGKQGQEKKKAKQLGKLSDPLFIGKGSQSALGAAT
jgi:hypothetical protein